MDHIFSIARNEWGESGDPGTDIECERGWHRVAPVDPDNPGGHTSSEPCLDQKDEHGFYLSRKDELGIFLSANNFGMFLCDLLNQLQEYPFIETWQTLSTFTPSFEVKNRLSMIRNREPAWIVDYYNLQNLDEAYGPAVNCDFFPLKITNFPEKFPGGPRFSPREFLEYFRLNMQNFITPNLNVTFGCSFTWFSDCSQYNLPFESSLGALASFNIHDPVTPFYNSGSVIISGYDNLVRSDGSHNYSFTFSTLETPFDGEHPVAGNRRFGIFNTANNPTEWIFYTIGVDRTWDFWDNLTNELRGGFEIADNLWKGVQENLRSFITHPSNNGSAEFFSKRYLAIRPNYEAVKKFLKKEITLSQLKILLNCP